MGLTHLKKFNAAGISYARKSLSPPLEIEEVFGPGKQTACETVTVQSLKLVTNEGPVRFTKVEFYLLQNADEVLLGSPFTREIGFDILANIGRNQHELEGRDMVPSVPLSGAGGTLRRLHSIWQTVVSLFPNK